MGPSLAAVLLLGLLAMNSCAAIYYAEVSPGLVDRLSRFRIVVLSPLAPESIVKEIRQGGSLVLGYISIASIGGWEPWARNVSSDLVIGENRFWGERIINVCKPGWRSVIASATRYIASEGFSGFFLDNLDIVDEYPWMKPCIIRIIKDIRSWYPGLKIMVNRGFTLLPDIARYIDYVLFEDLVTYYDTATHRYRFFTGEDLDWINKTIGVIHGLGERYGIRLYLLAYAPPDNASFLNRLCKLRAKIDPRDPLYVATWRLDTLGLCNPCAVTNNKPERLKGYALVIALLLSLLIPGLVVARKRGLFIK